MRIEQVIAAVARPVAVATVREIKAVVSFVREAHLHFQWLQRTFMGMPAFALVQSSPTTCRGYTDGMKCNMRGNPVSRLFWCSSSDRNNCMRGIGQA